jgi:hypothetical protein
MKVDVYQWSNWWIPIKATQFSREDATEVAAWCGGKLVMNENVCFLENVNGGKVYEGDWVIQVQGEFWSVDEEYFPAQFTLKDSREGVTSSKRKAVKESHGHVIRLPR